MVSVAIIIIKRKDLGGVMSKDCKDTVQTLKTMTKRDCDAKELIADRFVVQVQQSAVCVFVCVCLCVCVFAR